MSIRGRILKLEKRIKELTGAGEMIPPIIWTLGENKVITHCSQYRELKCPTLPCKQCDIEKCWLRRTYPKGKICLIVDDLWTMKKFLETKHIEGINSAEYRGSGSQGLH